MIKIYIKRKRNHIIKPKELTKVREEVKEIMRIAVRAFLETMMSKIRIDSGMTMGSVLTVARLYKAIEGMSGGTSIGKRKNKSAYLWSGDRFRGQRAAYHSGTIKSIDLGETLGYNASTMTPYFDNNRASMSFTWYYTVPQHLFNDGNWGSLVAAQTAMLEALQTQGKARINDFMHKFISG